MTSITQVLELHRQQMPVAEIAAACLTSIQRVEQIIRDAVLPRVVKDARRTRRGGPARRQAEPLPQSIRTVPGRTSPAAMSPSKSERDPAFGDQCVYYTPHLRRWARRLEPNRSLAEDLLQETILRALANQHHFAAGSNLRAWLFAIMHNLCANEVRRARRRGEPLDLVDADAVAVSGGQEINQQLQELRRGLEQLPADRREILLLAHYHEHSYSEISRMLQVPQGTVRSRLARARALLRRAVEGRNGQAMRPTRD